MDGERLTFGRWLRRERERDGRSAEALSRAAGLEKSYVAKLESGAVKTPGEDKWRPLARELRIPDPVMAAAVGGYFPGDAPQPLPPPRSRVLADPTLPRDIKDAVRHLVPDVPDEELHALARAMAAVQRQRREEAEAEMGPPGRLPARSPQSRDGHASGDGAPHNGTAG